MIIPIPVGPGPAPDHRWVGTERARRIRARCTIAGVVLLLWALVASTATLVLPGLLPPSGDPIRGVVMVFALGAAILPLIVGLYALGARRYVSPEHVDVAGGRVLGRGMLAVAVFNLLWAALAGTVLSLAGAVSGYSLLPMSCGVLAIVGALLTRAALRAPHAPTPG